jgi:hypothetical protein
LNPINYSALARIDPAKGPDLIKRDVTLDPGWTFTGMVHGPDGKPLSGVESFAMSTKMKGTEFTVRGFNPRRPHDLLFQHLEKGLFGIAHPPKENGGSVTVRMEPGAAVTGRLVDADRHPRAGVKLEVAFRKKEGGPDGTWSRYSHERIMTDQQGRFHIERLLPFPGYEFRLEDCKGELLIGGAFHSGKTKDLGDVQVKTNNE